MDDLDTAVSTLSSADDCPCDNVPKNLRDKSDCSQSPRQWPEVSDFVQRFVAREMCAILACDSRISVCVLTSVTCKRV